MTQDHGRRVRSAEVWLVRSVAVAGLAVVAWVLATAGGAVVHAHPAHPLLLAVTAAASAVVLWRSRHAGRAPAAPTPAGTSRAARARRVARGLAGALCLLLGVGCVVAAGWARPSAAVAPALTAMASDDAVTVDEGVTAITMVPTGGGDATALFFQPGARVDARAYAAVLRPVAEAGHTVVITKQPLGVAFLATGAFDAARAAHPQVQRWVVGGHSLGGVVAALEADAADDDAEAPAVGLLLYASYPASDLSTSLTAQVESVSGSLDGLATPADVQASRADLPADAHYTVVQGGVHAFFGDYGAQAGDGTPTVDHATARARIQAATVAFVERCAG